MAYREERTTPRVRCCVCGQEVEQSKTDIVELGYRCMPCSTRGPYAGAAPPVADPAMEVYVPAGALIKPAGANANLDGTVTCIACGRSLPPAQADIVGEGYRCAACSTQAELARADGHSDIASHLSKRDRRELSGSGAMNAGGLVCLIGGVVLLAATGGTAGYFLTIGGVVSLIGGTVRRS
jgi:DNA-directed RNA polymerase subunit RPC12/RpoP